MKLKTPESKHLNPEHGLAADLGVIPISLLNTPWRFWFSKWLMLFAGHQADILMPGVCPWPCLPVHNIKKGQLPFCLVGFMRWVLQRAVAGELCVNDGTPQLWNAAFPSGALPYWITIKLLLLHWNPVLWEGSLLGLCTENKDTDVFIGVACGSSLL